MQTSDPGLLFRSEAELRRDDDRHAKLLRMQNVGDPISLGNSKPLSIHVEDDLVWTAESNGTVVKRDLETNSILRVFRGHKGPVSALCICRHPGDQDSPRRRLVISGSWDKHLRIFDDETGRLLSDTEAHTDFVKAITYLDREHVIVSGGSDKEIRFWELSSTSPQATSPLALKPMGFVRQHTRPVVCLITSSTASTREHTLYSADSMVCVVHTTFDCADMYVGRAVRMAAGGRF
ncbi:WD40 repeat-like protein [Calocera viscosa TUFC12733]|uniref:WD40 repeat-like protein n=1 Tax=Calocera viscosa (strain TUFC12733) TaxID=1330018 RepID=A0A167NNB9_CALVF|nr:WD40 repeat-like protein [Calocera viscosa TUFC12733]